MEMNSSNEAPVTTQRESGYVLGRITGGLIIITIGALFLARELGFVLPAWLFTWKMLLLAIAFYFAVRYLFRSFIWIVLLLAGIAFMSDDMTGLHIRQYTWPVLLIVLGVYFIFRPRREPKFHNWRRYAKNYDDRPGMDSSEDYIDVVALFSGTKSNVISKNFKGGDVVSIFGGAELDLSQANINGKVLLEVTVVFGGAVIKIPSNWEVQSEAVAIMGGIEDKRPVTDGFSHDHTKVLVISGTAAFGGISIEC
ncbi:MAG: hypothetical protein ABIQ40_12650 [Bacteroidia bacterium]